MREKNSFLFLCDEGTESECLARQLVGTTQANALWALAVKQGDDIYLFNYNTGVVRGPYSARSGADCHQPEAWEGRYPVQVNISISSLTRECHTRSQSSPSIVKRGRPTGEIGRAASELFAWLQREGIPIA